MVHENTHLVATSTYLENKMTSAKRLGLGDAFVGETGKGSGWTFDWMGAIVKR